jgi:hypothetical protein
MTTPTLNHCQKPRCAQSSMKYLISWSSSELWKWHRRLGHLSFNLLCWLSGLGLLQGLPLLKFESNLVCAPCGHGKMITLHPILRLTPWWLSNPDNCFIWTLSVPLRFALWVVSDMFLSLWLIIQVTLKFSSWRAWRKCLYTFRAWLWGRTMNIPIAWKLYKVIMGLSSGMPHSISFVLDMVLINNFQPHMCLNKMGLWDVRTTL